MMIVSVALPPNYYPPVPPHGWHIAYIAIECSEIQEFRARITDKIGPRQAAGAVEARFDASLKLVATAGDENGVECKVATWIPNVKRTGKPGWSDWK